MPCALSWSGGKDSALALDRALNEGTPVCCLFNIYDGRTGRVRFHGVRSELIAAQARAMGFDLIQRATGEDGFEPAFLSILDELADRSIDAVMFGNIHLADVRAWYEERTVARGFQHREPLWGGPPADLLDELVRRGHRAVVVSVDSKVGRRDWLGRELNEELIEEIRSHRTVDPCGEHGEYHTFVFAGPLLTSALTLRAGVRHEEEGHLQLDLTLSDESPSASGDDRRRV